MKKMSIFQSIRYMMSIIWKSDKGLLLFAMFKKLVEEVFLSFLIIYLIQVIFNSVEQGTPFKQYVFTITILCLIHIFIHITSALYMLYSRYKEFAVYQHIFNQVIDKAKEIELQQYEQSQFYDKLSKTLDECLNKSMDGLNNLASAVGLFFSMIASMIMVATVDWRIILFVTIPVVVSLYFGNKQGVEYLNLREAETKDKRSMEYAKRVFYEKKYAGEIRLYNIRNVLFKKHKNAYESRCGIIRKYRKKIAFNQTMEVVLYLGISMTVTFIYVTYVLKTNKNANIASYVAILTIINFICWTVKDCIRAFVTAGRDCMYMNNLKDFLECEVNQAQRGNEAVKGTLGDITFEHVTFTYTGSTTPVIQDLSFSIQKGEKVALVGENGAGKTTLIKILMGLYPVQSGKISVGGTDLQKLSPKEYLKHFGVVFQDLQIFGLTIGENVLMKRPETKEEEEKVIDVLKQAQFGDVLERLEDPINTIVTKEFDDDGFVCSGGQAQKLAIARVIAKDPDVVILDEPSSALDPIAEYNMYENMLRITEHKTVFFISHRLSVARLADRIFFLENGRIVEQGTHDELIEKNGKYAELFHAQARSYVEKGALDVE